MRRGRRKSQADASRAEFTARRNRAGDTVVAVCSSPPVSAVANDCVVAAGDEAGAGSSVANVTIGASSGGSGVPQARCGMAGSLAEGAEENDGFALLDVTTDVSLGSRSAPPPPSVDDAGSAVPGDIMHDVFSDVAEEVAARVNHLKILSHDRSDADSDDEVAPYMLPDESPPDSESDSGSNDGGLPFSGSSDGAGSAQELPERPAGDDGVVRSENSDGSPVVYRPSCLTIFCDVEDLYTYLLVRGARQLTEEMYDIVRAGFNVERNARLPSMSYIRRSIAPAISSWMLPLHVAELPLSCGTGSVNVR